MRYTPKVIIASSLCAFLATAQGQPNIQFTKDQLKAEFAGNCGNPDVSLPRPIPERKREAWARWCTCVEKEIDEIPDERLQQATEETFQEYAKYKADPSRFVPVAQYSLIRISKACAKN